MHALFITTRIYHQICGGMGYLKNNPTRTLDDKTPFEVWYGECRNVSHLHELGCKVWVHISGDNPKIYNRSVKCMLVGCSDSSKAYRCLHRPSGCIYVTRNVIFAESQDLRECPSHPGLTVEETGMNPHNKGNMQCIHSARPLQVEEDMPNPSETMPCRSPRLSKNNSSTNPSAYIQVIDNETTSSDPSLPESHTQTDILEGYIHFTFNENKWCNLSNEDPILYRDAFSRPDVPFWQAAYKDKMKTLRKHKVWDLIPHDQVPTG